MRELIWSYRFDADTQTIYAWLEEQSEGAGDVFYRTLLTDLGQLARQPWSGSRVVNSNARRLLVVDRRYAAIHTVEHRGVVLQALFDMKQDSETYARMIREIVGGLEEPPRP